MPYNPGVQPHGDQYLYGALGSLGEDFAEVMKKREETAKTDAYNDMVVQHAYESKTGPFADPDPVKREEAFNKYQTMGHAQKTGFAAGLAANIVSDWKQQSEQLQVQQHADVLQQHAVENEYRNRALQQQWDIANLREQTKYEPVTTDPLTVGGKDVPGIGVNRKTGQYVYFKESGLERDPGTGALGVRTSKGEFKPVTAEQLLAMDMDQNNPLRQTKTPQEKNLWEKLTGGSAAPSGAANSAPAHAATNGQFVAGKKYKDKDGNIATYLGGDPNDPKSWQ